VRGKKAFRGDYPIDREKRKRETKKGRRRKKRELSNSKEELHEE